MARDGSATRRKLLETAEDILLNHPEETISMRRIAKICGISPATIYEHFSGKDELVAAVMIHDWHKCLAKMREDAENAHSFAEGLVSLSHEITLFSVKYSAVWNAARSAETMAVMPGRHEQLIEEIRQYVHQLIERFSNDQALAIERLLAENVLLCAVRKEISEEELKTLGNYISK